MISPAKIIYQEIIGVPVDQMGWIALGIFPLEMDADGTSWSRWEFNLAWRKKMESHIISKCVNASCTCTKLTFEQLSIIVLFMKSLKMFA